MNAQIEQNQHLAVFEFNGKEKHGLRVEIDEISNPWFCAKDVCEILGYVNAPDAINKHCKPLGSKTLYRGVTTGKKSDGSDAIQQVELIFINEGNLNRLLLRSNKPEAERLSDLVCDEILPSIRKTGGYLLPGANQQLSLIEENKKLDSLLKRHDKYLEIAEERYEHTIDIFEWMETKIREFDRIINDIAWKVYEKEREAMKKKPTQLKAVKPGPKK